MEYIHSMRIGILQLNYRIGDIAGNAARICSSVQSLTNQSKLDLVVTSEMALTGYPPKDLLLNPSFLSEIERVLMDLSSSLPKHVPVLVGVPWVEDKKIDGSSPMYNAAALLFQGNITCVAKKCLLPSYDVFDERRYFSPGSMPTTIEISGTCIGLTICEDIWNHYAFSREGIYESDPVLSLIKRPIDMMINMSASPYDSTKFQKRTQLLTSLAKDLMVPIVYVNQIGGNDDLVFDGGSMYIEKNGTDLYVLHRFQEEVIAIDTHDVSHHTSLAHISPEEEVWHALTLGLQDFVYKSEFTDVVIGISGGIDSAVVSALAVHTFGASHVKGFFLPSEYTSEQSKTYAHELCVSLGISLKEISIIDLLRIYDKTLNDNFGEIKMGTTRENIQARIRSSLLMSISQEMNALLLNTGNKSEVAVGYCTIYGDMAGAVAPLGDLYKTQVYALAQWINHHTQYKIPKEIIGRAPTAELSKGQFDQQSLPPYDELDTILTYLIEKRASVHDLILKGYDSNLVKRVCTMIHRSEFKRHQSAPAIKISPRAFRSGWKMPIISSSL